MKFAAYLNFISEENREITKTLQEDVKNSVFPYKQELDGKTPMNCSKGTRFVAIVNWPNSHTL